jgi:hypothetical protein
MVFSSILATAPMTGTAPWLPFADGWRTILYDAKAIGRKNPLFLRILPASRWDNIPSVAYLNAVTLVGAVFTAGTLAPGSRARPGRCVVGWA